IKRAIQLIDVEAWSSVRVGSLYHALHQMEREGLVVSVRYERSGTMPMRTIYEITADGETELEILRERALRQVEPARDPFDVALWVSGPVPAAELEAIVTNRLETLRLQVRALRDE